VRGPAPLRGAIMVCGTSSHAGKSLLVAGLCRALGRAGVRVAPFKGQNMSLNSTVTPGGAEIGRAQWAQAVAAGAVPEAAMNPVLLKPTGERASQVVVMGRPWATLDAAGFQQAKAELVGIVDSALADLRRRYDVVVLEGAGSPAEINLPGSDLVNLGLAARAGVPAIVVGDIDRGGVFAHLYGTVALLPAPLRAQVRGFVINKFRGDPALLGDGPDQLAARCGVPTLGVLPFLEGVVLDAEDSLALLDRIGDRTGGGAWGPGGPGVPGEAAGAEVLDVAVVRFPRVSNFTDLDPLALEPGVAVRFVTGPGALGDPDLVVLPGTKATVADLAWLRGSGLAAALERLRRGPRPPVVLGVCGGYQMLGRRIEDPAHVESDQAEVDGLGWLDVVTRFHPVKRTAQRRGTEVHGGLPVAGYEIHHGQPRPAAGAIPWFALEPDVGEGRGGNRGDGRPGADGGEGPGCDGGGDRLGRGRGDRLGRGFEEEGVRDEPAGVFGTSLHGLLECDALRGALLAFVARRRRRSWSPSGLVFAAARRAQLDRLADACEAHLDLGGLWSIVRHGAASAPTPGGTR